MFSPQSPRVLRATSDIAPTLQHDWGVALLREHERGEQAAGTKSHHNRAFVRGLRGSLRWVKTRIGCRENVSIIAVFFQYSSRIFDFDIDDIDERDFPLLTARIVTALEHLETNELFRFDP